MLEWCRVKQPLHFKKAFTVNWEWIHFHTKIASINWSRTHFLHVEQKHEQSLTPQLLGQNSQRIMTKRAGGVTPQWQMYDQVCLLLYMLRSIGPSTLAPHLHLACVIAGINSTHLQSIVSHEVIMVISTRIWKGNFKLHFFFLKWVDRLQSSECSAEEWPSIICVNDRFLAGQGCLHNDVTTQLHTCCFLHGCLLFAQCWRVMLI